MIVANIFTTLFLLTGQVTDKSTDKPIPNTTIQIIELNKGISADENGKFILNNIPNGIYTIQISHLNYKTYQTKIDFNENQNLIFSLDPQDFITEEVIISAIRVNQIAPVSQKTIDKADIVKNYSGQEMPVLLSQTPSVNFYSDGGNYFGYSYMRLRGIDQSRINFTLNGLPLNEPEDQGVYFANFADFANNLQSLQIQRGVGSSTNGTASYAGSVNFESVNLADSSSSSDLQIGRGSYNSYRISPGFYTGLMKNGFSFYGRYSLINSEGYKYHSGTHANSFFMSGAYFAKKYLIKFTAFSGRTKNDLAYNPVSIDSIKIDPKINSISNDEKDNFMQDLAQLQYVRSLNKNTTLTASTYYTHLEGGYDIKFAPTLVQNFAVASHFAGAVINLNFSKNNWQVYAGVHANTYKRDHFSAIQPFISNHVYFNSGYKKEISAFAKLNYSINRFTFFIDLQVRQSSFNYHPDKSYHLNNNKTNWMFFNPKVGINYQINDFVNVYSSVGKTSREPTRNDIFAGFDDLDTNNIKLIGDFTKVKPETVTDYEFGTHITLSNFSLQANIFEMRFKNEIAPIGKLSYIGLPLRKNVAESFRRGVEWSLAWKILPELTFTQNTAYLYSRIKTYLSETDSVNIKYRNITPLLSPNWIVNNTLEYKIKNIAAFRISGKYVSQSFLANDNNKKFVTPSFFIMDFAATINFYKKHSISFQVNNFTDRQYFTSGQVQANVPYYFVQAPRNYFITLHLKF